MSPEQSRTGRGAERRTNARVLVPVGQVVELLDKHGVPDMRQKAIAGELTAGRQRSRSEGREE